MNAHAPGGALAESPVRPFRIRRWAGERSEGTVDVVAAEEPLDIHIAHHFKGAAETQSLALTMRTPGHDRELAAGLLLSEGVISRAADVVAIHTLGSGGSNELMVELAPHVDFESWRLRRNTILNSSCGVCGKVIQETITPTIKPTPRDFKVTISLLHALPEMLRARQQAFAQTGGLHAAALVTREGEIESVFEDIGRHNALDKLLGACLLRDDLPVGDRLLFLSSRSSFELVQKTAMAGGLFLATVGGASSLAIETARHFGITLTGFVRDGRCNVYAGEWRIHSN